MEVGHDVRLAGEQGTRRQDSQAPGDGDLAEVREASVPDKLLDAERNEWQSFWADVDVLLKDAIGH